MSTDFKGFDNIINGGFEEVKKSLIKIGKMLEKDIKSNFSNPGSGRIYRKRYSKETYQASAPKEPPAIDTGDLKESISTNWTGSGMDRVPVECKYASDAGVGNPGGDAKTFRVVVGSNIRQAAMLEFGTRKMKPRPYFTPAIERLRPKIAEILKQDLKAYLVGRKAY